MAFVPSRLEGLRRSNRLRLEGRSYEIGVTPSAKRSRRGRLR